MQREYDQNSLEGALSNLSGDPVRLRRLIEEAISEAEACDESLLAADLSALADRLVKSDDERNGR